jgi:tetratricopeptide (TPR) repeat protein
MKSIRQIEQLLEDGAFSEAEEALLALKREGSAGSIPDYLLGCLYDDYKNPQRSRREAKRYFTAAIQTDDPVEEAFLQLARLERGRTHTERILKRGVQCFPRSVRLHERLLGWTAEDAREKLFLKMVGDGLASRDATALMIRTYTELKQHSKALDLIATFAPRDDNQAMMVTLLKALCLLESGDHTAAAELLTSLIESDIAQSLGYAQYFGLIICRLQQSKLKLALRILDDVPGEEEFHCPYDFEFGPLDRCYLRYADRAIADLLKATRSRKVVAKARGVRALIGGNEEFGYNLPRAKLLADLRFANKHLPSNLKYCLQLATMATEDGDCDSAHRLTVQYLRNAAWQGRDALEEVDYSYFEAAPEAVFTAIRKQVLALLQGGDYTDMEVLPLGPCVPIIERLFKNKGYQDVVEMADAMSDKVFKVSPILFEVAYSYGECAKPVMARRCYEVHNRNSPGSPAVENNLGVLCEEDGDYEKAKEFYEKALSRETGSELYKRNLTRIIDAERAAKRAMKADLNVKRALIALWYERDIDDFIPDPATSLTRALPYNAAEARKALQLLESAVAILPVKKNRHNYQCPVYRVNPYLLAHLNTIEAEVDRTADIVSVIEQITPDSLATIGYDDKLTSSLKRVASFDLQQALQRDLREAAISLLTASYKTTMVLSGSIIEAILLDRVSGKGISKYKMENGRNRSTSRMDLGDLLFVSQKESIVDPQLYHLAQALRGFRNLIHPGLEKRKAAISVTEQNAKIAWDITRKLICEI